ncbi:hypothetical protein D3C84_181600 [compost metagenome]
MLADSLDGFFADATRWHVNDAFQRRIVAAPLKYPQVRHGILDLGPFEEALAAIDPIRDAFAQQRFFKYA